MLLSAIALDPYATCSYTVYLSQNTCSYIYIFTLKLLVAIVSLHSGQLQPKLSFLRLLVCNYIALPSGYLQPLPFTLWLFANTVLYLRPLVVIVLFLRLLVALDLYPPGILPLQFFNL